MLSINNIIPVHPTTLNEHAPKVLRLAHRLPMKYWLGGGTLLGLYRDKDFISYDTDIDVEVEGYRGIQDDILSAIDSPLIRSIFLGPKVMQMAFIENGVVFDIYILWPDKDKMVNYNEMGTMETPRHFYEKLSFLETKYGKYPIPNPVEDYLVVRYGQNWRVPSHSKGLYAGEI